MTTNRSKKTRKRFHPLRIAVRLLGVLILLLVIAFSYLRIFGVPDQILRIVVQRANDAGIPIGIDKVRLTTRGWRGDNVRYYSLVPADKAPIFQTDTVFIHRNISPDQESYNRWKYDIEAQGVKISPSVEWGVEIPEDSQTRTIGSIKLTLSFLPDRIEMTDGSMEWWGSTFSVNGTVIKATPETIAARKPKAPKKQKTILPEYVSAAAFKNFEDRINAIQVAGSDEIDINFHIDGNNYAASRLNLKWFADDFSARGVHFSRIEFKASYLYPTLNLEQLGLYQRGKPIKFEGRYDLSTKLLQGKISNSITETTMLKLLPGKIQSVFNKLDMQFDQLPQLEINMGPCKASDALNDLSGTFLLKDFTFGGSTIETIGGTIERKNNRLELSELKGIMQGLEHRAEETGSGMLGGPASGSVYFDSNTYWFGVDAEMNLDPTLLIGPLSSVRIATNVINRLKFNDEVPPSGQLTLGSCVTNWSTFFLDIHMTGKEVTLHDAVLSSVDVTAAYSNKVLRLDPLTALQGTNELAGPVSVNFKQKTAGFDILTSIDPLTIQNAAYPPLGVFGGGIKTSGKTFIEAKGILDWKRMQVTDFKAEVEAEQIDLPVARITGFAGTVTGAGPLLTVTNAQFALFDGRGSGTVTIELNPDTPELPYGVDLSLKQVDFQKCLLFFKPDAPSQVSGLMDGTISLNADLKQDFFESANGLVSLALTKGQLADLPFFEGFSRLMRKLFPAFNTFSIHSYTGSVKLIDGVFHSEDSYFEGELLSAKARGIYSRKDGFDARVQVQTLSSRPLSQIVRIVTDPLLQIFEIKLKGPLDNPSWEFDNI